MQLNNGILLLFPIVKSHFNLNKVTSYFGKEAAIIWRLQQYYSNEASGLQNKLRGSDSV